MLAQPLPPYVPLPEISPDPRREPDEGSLGWLLAYCLSARQLQQKVGLLTQSGVIEHDPGLLQVWDHARQFYREDGGARHVDSRFAVAPELLSLQRRYGSNPTPALTERSDDDRPLREEAFTLLSTSLALEIMERLGVSMPDLQAHPAPSRAEVGRVIAIDYILDRSVDLQLALSTPLKRSHVKGWSTLEVFGVEACELARLLRRVAQADVDALDIDSEPDADMRQQMRSAASQYLQYVEQCVERVSRMRPAASAVS